MNSQPRGHGFVWRQRAFWGVVLCLFLWAIGPHRVNGAPLYTDPDVTRLSGKQGLSGTSINSLAMDKDGFLWLASDVGLDRYDGYQVISYAGQPTHLTGTGLGALMAQQQGYLWLSSAIEGVVRIDLNSGNNQVMMAYPQTDTPEYYQSAQSIKLANDNSVWVGLNERVVQWHPDTGQHETWYQIRNQDPTSPHVIRDIAFWRNYLVVATTMGVMLVDNASKAITELKYVPGDAPHEYQYHAKTLLVDDSDQLWVGTVAGLYRLPPEALDRVKGPSLNWPAKVVSKELNVWDLVPTHSGFYAGTDKGLYLVGRDGEQLTHLFRPSDIDADIGDDDIVDIQSDDSGNLWLAVRDHGVLYWRAKRQKMQNILQGDASAGGLSAGTVMSLYQQNDEILWAGTRNGLNRINLVHGTVEHFLTNADDKAYISGASILDIVPVPDKPALWLITYEGVREFSLVDYSLSPFALQLQFEALKQQVCYSIVPATQDEIALICDRGLYRVNLSTGKLHFPESTNAKINAAQMYAFIGALPGDDTGILLSAENALYRYDVNTGDLTLWHGLSDALKRKGVGPESWIVDDEGILWVSYSGVALVGMDLATRAQKYLYTQEDGLPAAGAYSLVKDDAGSLWMSSAEGLIKFYPENGFFRRFGYDEGLVTEEFYPGAGVRLQSGRLAFGSVKGITLVNPEDWQHLEDKGLKVSITGVSLLSRALPQSLKDMGSSTIKLNHDDLGLEIHYSTLNYDAVHETLYGYELSGAETISVVKSAKPSVFFPRLQAGVYEFSVWAYSPKTGRRSPPQTLTIEVERYFLTSPLMFVLIGLLLAGILAAWWLKTYHHERALLEANARITRSERRLQLALAGSNSGIWEWDPVNKVFVEQWLDEALNSAREEKMSFDAHVALIQPEHRKRYLAAWQAFINDPDGKLDVTYKLKSSSGQYLWYRDLGSILRSEKGKRRITGTYTDVTESMAVQEQARLFGEAFKYTLDWVAVVDANQQLQVVNPAMAEIFGLDENDVSAVSWSELAWNTERGPFYENLLSDMAVDGHWRGEEKVSAASGQVYDVLINIYAVPGSDDPSAILYYLVIFTDISEQKDAQRKLHKLASFDTLTNLPNRALLMDRLRQGINIAKRHHHEIAVMFVDLDKFKQVNDSLGHKAGDELLRTVASRLAAALRSADTIARIGGDEFVILLEDCSEQHAIRLANELVQVCQQSMMLEQQEVSVSTSIGIAMYPVDGEDAEALLKHADIAMYHAKELGRNNAQFFKASMNHHAQERLQLISGLKLALQKDQFFNMYQPIVDIATGTLLGVELLMRWRDSQGNLVSPAEFIPVAEELNIIVEMTWLAMDKAMQDLSGWYQAGHRPYISLNLSARHFDHPELVEGILSRLQQHNLPHTSLRLEITESALMTDYEKAQATMQDLHDAKLWLALDDFGTGYSSLKYLREFPIDILKIDRSFVMHIGQDSHSEAIIDAIISMANSLDLRCVAEGIETVEQARYLISKGCFWLQGYLLSQPVLPAEVPELLARRYTLAP